MSIHCCNNRVVALPYVVHRILMSWNLARYSLQCCQVIYPTMALLSALLCIFIYIYIYIFSPFLYTYINIQMYLCRILCWRAEIIITRPEWRTNFRGFHFGGISRLWHFGFLSGVGLVLRGSLLVYRIFRWRPFVGARLVRWCPCFVCGICSPTPLVGCKMHFAVFLGCRTCLATLFSGH